MYSSRAKRRKALKLDFRALEDRRKRLAPLEIVALAYTCDSYFEHEIREWTGGNRLMAYVVMKMLRRTALEHLPMFLGTTPQGTGQIIPSDTSSFSLVLVGHPLKSGLCLMALCASYMLLWDVIVAPKLTKQVYAHQASRKMVLEDCEEIIKKLAERAERADLEEKARKRLEAREEEAAKHLQLAALQLATLQATSHRTETEKSSNREDTIGGLRMDVRQPTVEDIEDQPCMVPSPTPSSSPTRPDVTHGDDNQLEDDFLPAWNWDNFGVPGAKKTMLVPKSSVLKPKPNPKPKSNPKPNADDVVPQPKTKAAQSVPPSARRKLAQSTSNLKPASELLSAPAQPDENSRWSALDKQKWRTEGNPFANGGGGNGRTIYRH
ncbi:hypothetical protein PENSPDRAFT_757799 [Peniophora sp. CONT]|nr:hypothetical protein PENSPDRAFT_757799 [Peniophora sp. CONT]